VLALSAAHVEPEVRRMTKMIVLHGYTMNASVMREHLGGLAPLLEREIELVFVDAPHTCSEAAVDRLYSFWDAPRLAPPHLTWWESTEDGREYRGWEETRERIRAAMADGEVGFLGFSQGAILSTAVAALAEHGEMPPVRFAILVAGRTPRADVLQPVLAKPLRTPSLHVWGAADTMATGVSEELSSRFEPGTREVVVWDGDHRVPRTGDGADAILRFIRQHSGDRAGT
jgi:pimeloyl-ACP methyl ester carboxylesterase